MKKLLSIFAALAVVLTLATSCHRSKTLINRVPASATAVATIDAKALLENAGCEVKSDEIVLSADLESLLGNFNAIADVREILDTYAVTLDLDEIVFAVYNGDEFLGFSVKDADRLREALKGRLGAPAKDKGFLVFTDKDGDAWALKDDQLWVCDDLDTLDRMFAAAEEDPFTDTKVYKSANSDATFCLCGNFGNQLAALGANSATGCFWLDLKGSKCTGEAFLLDEKGDRIPFGDILDDIDTSFLSEIPANSNFVMAVGNVTDPRLRALMKLGANELGALGFLVSQIEGTAALAATMPLEGLLKIDPADENNEYEILEWFRTVSATLLMPYTAAVTEKAMKLVEETFPDVPPTAPGENMKLTFRGLFDIYVGQAGDYMRLSTEPETGAPATGLDRYFKGQKAALYSRYDHSDATAAFGIDFDSEGFFQMGRDVVRFESSVSSGNILENSVKVWNSPTFRNWFSRMLGGMGGYQDDCAYVDYDDEWDEPDGLENYY